MIGCIDRGTGVRKNVLSRNEPCTVLITGVDLGDKAEETAVDLHQTPEFRERVCGLDATEVVAIEWGFAIKATDSADGCGGVEGFMTQLGHQRLTKGSLIQDLKEARRCHWTRSHSCVV